MQKIHQGHEVSLLGFSLNQQKFSQSKHLKVQGLLLPIVAAFFIIAIAAAGLNALSNKMENTFIAQGAEIEYAAFQPGQFVSQEIDKGYLQK